MIVCGSFHALFEPSDDLIARHLRMVFEFGQGIIAVYEGFPFLETVLRSQDGFGGGDKFLPLIGFIADGDIGLKGIVEKLT